MRAATVGYIAATTLAPTMAQGVPHFFQQGVRYFLIYRWREKWKPLRFSSVRRAAGAGRGAEKRVNGTAEKGSNVRICDDGPAARPIGD